MELQAGLPSEIIDSQLHELAPRSEVVIDDPREMRRIMLEVTMSAMDAVGVDAALLAPIDTGFADLAISEFPERFASIPMVLDPSAPDISERIAGIRETPGILGIRVVSMWSSTDHPTSPPLQSDVFEPTFAAAEKHGVPVFLMISGTLSLAAPILEAHPDLSLIIDHLGIRQPPMEERDTPPFRRLSELLALSKYPNLAVKVCGFPALSEAGYPYDDIWPFVYRIFEAFGPERLMWGSDIPRFQGRIGFRPWHAREDFVGKHSYADALDLFRNTSRLTLQEKQLLLGGTLRRILSWPRSMST